jgi:DNA topoisomerase-2
MKVSDFIHTDLKSFSRYDTERSLPNIVDGLKLSQRKIIHGLITRGESKDSTRVSQLGAYVSQITHYEHGEDSLYSAIVGMAQSHTGSNGVNLLEPEGQFGSILTSESASPRYIYTKLSDNFREIFVKEDDILLQYKDYDGESIEPKFYYPIIPMSLVNGSVGIGTGYATKILNYSIHDIGKQINNKLEGKPVQDIVPSYKNFKGTIAREGKSTIITGKYKKLDSVTLKITELPIGTNLTKYLTHLNKLIIGGTIKDFDDDSTEDGYNITIRATRETLKFNDMKLKKTFKLESTVTENLTLWDEHDDIKVFNSTSEIIEHFVDFRLNKYSERKQLRLEELDTLLKWQEERIKFIKFYISNSTLLAKLSKVALIVKLTDQGFTHIDKLLSMKIYSLTKDSIVDLLSKVKESKKMITELKGKSAKELYTNDLQNIKV